MTEKRKKILVNIAMIVVVVGALAALGIYYLSLRGEDGKLPSIEEFLRSFGAWTIPAYAVLYVVGSPIPMLAPLLSAAGGLIFGAVWGTVITMVIATGSALVPFTLSRRLGREWLAKKLKGKKIDNIYRQSEGEKGFAFILIMRLIPILPWEVQNYVAGLSRVKVPTFILATIIGILPGTFALAFLGSSVSDPGSPRFWISLALNAVLIGITVLIVRIRSKKKKADEKVGQEPEAVPDQEGEE